MVTRELRMLISLAIPAVFMMSLACSDRPRSNPLDPANEVTGGLPGDLTLVSRKHEVNISWSDPGVDDMTRFRLYRKQEGETDFSIRAYPAKGSVYYKDTGLPYGRAVQYYIAVEGEDYLSVPSRSTAITPGPCDWWVSDYYAGFAARLSYDGVHLQYSTPFPFFPIQAAPDTVNGLVWLIDWTGYLVKLNPYSGGVSWFPVVHWPRAVALCPETGNIWVIEEDGDALSIFDTSGVKITSLTQFSGLTCLRPSGPEAGFWLADSTTDAVFLLDCQGAERMVITKPLSRPVTVDCYRREGWIWVGDGDILRLLQSQGSELLSYKDQGSIIDVAAHQNKADCWMVVREGDGSGSTVVKIDSAGTVLVRISGFMGVRSIAADDFSGGCMVAEADRGRVIRLDRRGAITGEFTGFQAPWHVIKE